MNETVSKRRVTDVDTVRTALVGSGWHRHAFATETDLYYELPTGGTGRMRTCGSFTEVSTGNETRLISLPAESGAFHEMTKGWPPKAAVKVEKTRTTYLCESLPGVRVDLDAIPGTGMFVKIRVGGDPDLLDQIEAKLGFDILDPADAPYRELVAA